MDGVASRQRQRLFVAASDAVGQAGDLRRNRIGLNLGGWRNWCGRERIQ